MSDTSNKTMENYTAGWYNTLATALKLDDNSFQLTQGSLPLESTSVPLFQMCDSVPPMSIGYHFSTSQWNRFSQDYQSLLFALKPGSSANELQQVLGDSYFAWIKYRNAFYQENPTSTESQEDLFKAFANQRLDPSLAQTAIAAYEKSSISPINEAIAAFKNQANYLQGTPKYNQTIEQVNALLVRGDSASISYDSSTAETDVSHTWAEGGMGGGIILDIFDVGGEGAGTFNQINQTASSSKVTIQGSISKYATVPVGPGAWFNSGVMNNAYKNKDNNNVWDVNSQTTWETCFGTDGNMQRVISSLIIVDGLDITVTSHASFSKDDYQKITQESSIGIFPFFFGESESTHTKHFTYNADSSISVTIKSNVGNPKIIGVNVIDIAEAFNG